MEGKQEILRQLHAWSAGIEIALLLIGIAIILGYYLRLLTIRIPKKKYDFINKFEIASLKIGTFFLVFSLMLLLDNIVSVQFDKFLSPEQFSIYELIPYIFGFFVMFIVGVAIYAGLRSYLDVYYPNYMGRRLEKIRYSQKRSSETGGSMKLLNEQEEDIYLTEEMQGDEKSLKYDYDVWLDEQTGYVQIEKYDMHVNAIICPSCQYRTFKSVHDHLVNTDEGHETLERDFECTYCGHEESKLFKVTDPKAVIDRSK